MKLKFGSLLHITQKMKTEKSQDHRAHGFTKGLYRPDRNSKAPEARQKGTKCISYFPMDILDTT